MEMNVVVAGEAGQGAFSVELELTETLSRLNYHFFATKNYMSRVRGGHNFHMIRIADHPVHALSGGKWDMVVALDGETERRHKPNLREGGIFLSREMTKEIGAAAKEAFGNIAASNSILVGIVLAVIGVSPGKAAEAAEPGKEKYLEKGFEFAARWKLTGAFPVSAKAREHRKFDGNQALALGAILGGCQFMAGYPMTPATSIMDYFSKAAAGLPIHFEQAEDEIAAINMVLGASYAGVRSMAATSGGGFALMQEAVSLAGMTETPVVIAVSQRPGPSTGLPTRTEQADLNFVLHAGHGEFPRIIFAPGAIGEMIALTRKGFELADRYQIPVFILTDQYFADSVQICEEEIPLDVGSREYREFDGTYKRYRLTEDGISPLTYPRAYRMPWSNWTPTSTTKRGKSRRIRGCGSAWWTSAGIKSPFCGTRRFCPRFMGIADAASFVLCWGSTRQIVKEAAERLSGEGIPAAVLHFGQVYPLTPEMIAPYRLEEKRLICVENNAGGQFARLLKSELGLAVDRSVLKYDGDCFTVEELYQALKGLLS